MGFEDDYIDLLRDPLKAPTIRLPPIVAPWRSNSDVSEKSLSTLRSLITSLLGVDWFDVYRIPKSKEQFTEATFNKAFDDAFDRDERVQDQISQIVTLEIQSGILKPKYVRERRQQLRDWLRGFYYNQLERYSNTSTSTRNNHALHLRIAYVVFAHILPCIFKDGIWIHKRTFYSFLERVKSHPSATVLLLPNHKSHIDYIIIHFMYARFQLETPLVIAGENLNVPVFGPYLKRLGAVFIKRKFSSDDFWYINNMKNLMGWKTAKPGEQIELFIEGTRSRNGKLMLAKTGFMQLLKESMRGIDAFVQPISMIYEKPYEFNEYLVELNGMDKVQESFTSIFSAGAKLLLGKSDNYGKLIIKFDDGFLRFHDYPDMKDLGNEVLRKIHDISYITEISVLGLAMSILFYKEVHMKRLKKSAVAVLFKELCVMLAERGADTEHLVRCVSMTDDEIVIMCESLVKNFLFEHVTTEDDEFMIMEETALVYYKNSLLNNFISEMFLIKTNKSPVTMTVLKKLFDFEFLTSRIDDTTELTQRDYLLFGDLLNPFIESYELVLNNLRGVIKITLKRWLHLLYISSPNVSYKESLNKSNILYAIYTLQSLKLIRLNKAIEIEVIDDDKMLQLRQYLHCLRTNRPLQYEHEVFQQVNTSLSELKL